MPNGSVSDRPESSTSHSRHPKVLSPRALNRITLCRQMLLRRAEISTIQALERLVGIQAQSVTAPYFGLWSRLTGFQTDDLATLIKNRQAVRIALMRSTIHLVTGADCLALRSALQTVLEQSLNSSGHGRKLPGMALPELAESAREFLDERPRSNTELRAWLTQRWPDRDVSSLIYAIRSLLPLIQVPPRGVWGEGGQLTYTTAEAWLGGPLHQTSSPDELVARYVAAFGPATVKDIQIWSGLTHLREVIDRLRPRFRIFHSEEGAELFDLPGAAWAEDDTLVPPRFLGEYDNLLFSYADRTRVISHDHRKALQTKNGMTYGTVLIDGFISGTWKITKKGQKATLLIRAFEKLSTKDASEVTEEGTRLLAFAAADAQIHDARIVANLNGE